MLHKILNSFDVWITAQGLKSKGRLRSVENTSLEGTARLRELIRELAVRGKLVPQDTSDEPASGLINRIEGEKARLIELGELRKQKKLPAISDEKKPFPIPRSWAFARLGDVTNYGLRDQIEPDEILEDEWVLELEDVEKITSKLLQRVYAQQRPPRSARNRFFKGDVLYGKLRPYLDKVIVADKDGVCTTEMIPFKGYSSIIPEYLRLVMKAPFFVRYASSSTHGMNLPRLGTDNARRAIIPIAPLNEQQRIVAKVDELMALCDRLEQQETDHLRTHRLLVETLLQTLIQAKDTNDFENAWSRIAANFDDLFTTEDSIDQLKQAILQLAVTGKLVPQDPNDEPASVLLERIKKERRQLQREGKIGKEKTLPPINESEIPFRNPNGWEFVRLGEITTKIGSGSTPKGGKESYVSEGILFLRSQNIWNHGIELNDAVFISEETHLRMSNTKVYPRDILLNITGGSLGRSTIFPDHLGEANVSQHVTIIRPALHETNSFLHLVIISPYGQKLIWERQVGANREGLSKKILEQFEIPIPPIAEQRRILSKVSQLLQLCEKLKLKTAESQAVISEVANSVLDTI